jgi:hypothetical protein
MNAIITFFTLKQEKFPKKYRSIITARLRQMDSRKGKMETF